MTLRNFDTPLDQAGVTRMVSQVEVSETVTVNKVTSSVNRTYLTKSEWDWNDLRDYVVYEIEQRFGPFPRDHYKEVGIFKAFMKRWESDAEAIARWAFEIEGGRWAGAPISIFRFAKNSDPFFAKPIMDQISAKL